MRRLAERNWGANENSHVGVGVRAGQGFGTGSGIPRPCSQPQASTMCGSSLTSGCRDSSGLRGPRGSETNPRWKPSTSAWMRKGSTSPPFPAFTSTRYDISDGPCPDRELIERCPNAPARYASTDPRPRFRTARVGHHVYCQSDDRHARAAGATMKRVLLIVLAWV